jgi:beta-galactosidase
VEVPNSWNSNSESNLTQTTTLMPFQTSWPVTWASGTVEAECLDQFGNVVATDSRTTAGSESKIVLTVVPELTRPDGTSFAVTANGSDAAFVVAQVEDANGNVEPLASDILTFSVTGSATYMGGSEQYVSTASDAYSTAPGNSELNYHAPGDPQLQVEGGMTKIALRSQFTTGTVTVTATAPGLTTGTTTFSVQPIPSVMPAPTAPTIIVPPANAAVTVGQSAMFSVTAAGTAPFTFQWLKNGSTIAGATNSTYTTPATTSADNNSDGDGTSAASAQAFATTQASTSGNEIVAINSGGSAVSNTSGGDASFVADEDVTGGGTDTSANAINTTGVVNAAPAAVDQSERAGVFTYTIPGLAAGTQYSVLLHFAEFYWTASGKRLFNVAINGTTVLSNFDIYAAAGANKALVEQFTANGEQ